MSELNQRELEVFAVLMCHPVRFWEAGPPRACFTAVIDDDNGRVFTTVGKGGRGQHSQRNSSHLCLKLLENCRPRASLLLPAQKLKGSKPSLNWLVPSAARPLKDGGTEFLLLEHWKFSRLGEDNITF